MGFFAWTAIAGLSSYLGANLMELYTTGDVVSPGEFLNFALHNPVSESITDQAVQAFVAVFDILPVSSGLPQSVFTGAQLLGSYLATINVLLPVDHIMIMLSMFVSLQFILFTFRMTMFIVSVVRGVSHNKSNALDLSPRF